MPQHESTQPSDMARTFFTSLSLSDLIERWGEEMPSQERSALLEELQDRGYRVASLDAPPEDVDGSSLGSGLEVEKYEAWRADQESSARWRSPSGHAGCIWKVCATLLVLGVLAASVGYFLFQRGVKLGARGFCARISAEMAVMDLTDTERHEGSQLLQALEGAFESGDLDFDDAIGLMERTERSRLREIIALMQVEGMIQASGDFSDEEKREGALQISRVLQGVSRGRLEPSQVKLLLAHAATLDERGSLKINRTLSTTELRAIASDAESMTRAAGMSRAGVDFDFVKELRRLVETVLPRERLSVRD